MCSYFRGLLSASVASLGRSIDRLHRKLPFYPEDLVKLENIVQADQGPLSSYFFDPTQEKLTERARLFDLRKDGLHDEFAGRIELRLAIVASLKGNGGQGAFGVLNR